MPIGNPQSMKERVDVLERTLLAINCFSNVVNAAAHNHTDLPQSDVVYLLEYLSESSLYKVEALRVMIHEQEAAVTAAEAPRRDRRRVRSVA